MNCDISKQKFSLYILVLKNHTLINKIFITNFGLEPLNLFYLLKSYLTHKVLFFH